MKALDVYTLMRLAKKTNRALDNWKSIVTRHPKSVKWERRAVYWLRQASRYAKYDDTNQELAMAS